MSDPLSVEFADRASGVRGWIGRGLPGLGDDQVLALVFDGDEQLFAGPLAEASLTADDGSATAEASSDGAKVRVEIGADAGAGPLSAGAAAIELETRGKRSLSCRGAFGSLAPETDAGLARTLVALREDGAALALRAARAPGNGEHGVETVEAWLSDPEGGDARPVEEPLLSTEYSGDGGTARAGLELWLGSEDQVPLRGAGTRVAGARIELDGWRLDAAFLDWVIEGIEGSGSYMIWRAGG